MSYELILTETRGRVGLITLNRPKVMNALNHQLVQEVMDALESFDAQEDVGAMVITGSEKAFAAGADIKEMAGKSSSEMKAVDYTAVFDRIRKIGKPVIAPVSGWALGGGCEGALSCDRVGASEAATPRPAEGPVSVAPGTHRTTSFDPCGGAAASGYLAYTIPAGWGLIEDSQASFILHRVPGVEAFVALIAHPLVSAEFEEGAICGPFSVVPGVGQRPRDLMSAISSRPGLVSTSPAPITIGGHAGTVLDLSVGTSWTGGCQAPEGRIKGIPLLQAFSSGSGPQVGVSEDGPLRLILLDLGDGRTLAIAIAFLNPDAPFDEQVSTVMPIIECFEFRSQAP